MNVASLELCKELCELSGWNDTEFDWCWDSTEQSLERNDGTIRAYPHTSCRAYDLGYLLRKLPVDPLGTRDYVGLNLWHDTDDWQFRFCYEDGSIGEELSDLVFEADTPEDAAAKLCIELFNQGILKKEQHGESTK